MLKLMNILAYLFIYLLAAFLPMRDSRQEGLDKNRLLVSLVALNAIVLWDVSKRITAALFVDTQEFLNVEKFSNPSPKFQMS